MLYSRWQETSRAHAWRKAVCENGRWLTFSDVARLVDALPAVDGAIHVARTGGAEFLAEILRGWRDGAAVMPLEAGAREPVPGNLPGREIALIKHTAGAAGVPRGIWFPAAAVIADGDRLTAEFGMDPETPNLAVVSLAHSYGFGNVVLPFVLAGVPVIFAAAPFPRVIEEACSWAQGKIDLPAVPPMWRAWLKSGVLRKLPVRRAVSAGAPLPLRLEQEVFCDAGLKIHNFYGASECGGIAWDASETPRDDERGVGKVMAGVRVEVSHEGKLSVSSDAVACGYDEPREGDELVTGSYLTRDIGFYREDGGLALAGNCGGAINVAGRKVSPAKVERAILASGMVRAVRVYGFASADPERYQEIGACVEIHDGAALADLKAELVRCLPLWEIPRRWEELRPE